jgi:hypothetical protein
MLDSMDKLLEEVVFGEKMVREQGPTWSCLSRSKEHNEQVPVIAWKRSTCPLCKTGRHVGNSIVHDFILGEGDDYVLYSWTGIWSSKTLGGDRDSTSTTPTPARRKEKGTHADTPEVKRESMPPDGNAGDRGAKDYETEDDEEALISRRRFTPGEWFHFHIGQLQPQGVERGLGGRDLSKKGEQDQD